MALSKPQELALFYILEVPYAARNAKIIGDGLIAEPHSVQGSVYAAYTQIQDYLTSVIYADTDLETELKSKINEWIALGNDMSTIEQGSVGNVTGLNDSAPLERQEIARRVIIMVPFYRYADQLRTNAGGAGGGGAFIPVVR